MSLRRGRRAALVTAGMVVAGVLGLAMGRLAPRAATLPPVPEPRVAALEGRATQQPLVLDGELAPTGVALVTSALAGRIEHVLGDVGITVHRGEILVQLDPSFHVMAVKRARADVVSAQRTLARARSRSAWTAAELARAGDLLEDEFTTRADYEVAEAALASARAEEGLARSSLAAAEVALEDAELHLRSTELAAPADGVVIARSASVGQLVAGGATDVPLFVIARDLDWLRLHVRMDESLAPRVQLGSTVPFSVKAYPGRRFEGSVRTVSDYAEAGDGGEVTYVVVLDVDNRDGLLRPGMSARANFEEAFQHVTPDANRE